MPQRFENNDLPDSDLPSAIDYIKSHSFTLKTEEKKQKLLEYFNLEHTHHYDKNALYRKISDSITNQKNFDKIEDIPFLPVQYFKEAGNEFASSEKIHRSLMSSATSGVPSVIPIDNETSKRQVFSLTSSLSDFIGKGRRPFLICDLEPAELTNFRDLAARHAAISGFTNFATEKNFILLSDKAGGYEPDIEKTKALLENISEPITICGFTFLVYIYLVKFCQENNIKVKLPEGSSIIHIGGWKKLEEQKVDRNKFVSDACEVFGVEEKNVVDIYGFTEQMGTVYPECEYGHKHVPDHAHLIVRNPYSYKILPEGEIGVGQFLSLVPKSYAGFSLLTDDLIQITGNNDCKCGRAGTRFKVIGRAKSAEIRGCGDIIASKIIKKETVTQDVREQKAELKFYQSKSLKDESIKSWDELNENLAKAQKSLAKLSTDEIIGILKEACKLWRADESLMEYRFQGVDYIISWLKSGEFERSLDLSLRGSKAHLDGFLPSPLDHRKFIAMPRGVVAHWVAGNVPSLGIISILLALVCKNANIVKLPKNSSNVLQRMLEILSKAEFSVFGDRKVSGKILSDAIYLMYIPRGSKDNEMLSMSADARIAWGGKEAIEAIVNLPKKYTCEDIIFGPKLSLAAIGRESIELERKASRVARSLAIDASVFDQKACASAHNVFIEKNGKVSPEKFVELLKKRMTEVSIQIPGIGDDFTVFDKIKSARLEYFRDNKASVTSPNNMQWSILLDEKLELKEPAYGRTIFVHAVDNLEGVAPLLSENNQVVGLAVKSSRRSEIAKLYLENGVSRITQMGHMADFTFPWDDIYPTEKLIRWCYA